MANMEWVITSIVAMGGFLAWFVRVTVSTQLSIFREDLRKEFGGRFLDAALAAAKLEPMAREIAATHDKLQQVEDYAHKTSHDLRNEIQECKLRLDVIDAHDRSGAD